MLGAVSACEVAHEAGAGTGNDGGADAGSVCVHRGASGAGATLTELSRRVHLSPSYLQRRFRAIVGVSPRRYAEA